MRARREGGNAGPPPDGGRFAGLALVAVAVVAVAACGYFGFRYIDRLAGVIGQPGAATMALTATADPTQLWSEADAQHCAAVAHAAATAPLDADVVDANPTVTGSAFAAMATTIACKATTRIERLCDPDAKATFIAEIKDYAARVDVALLGMKAQAGLMDMTVTLTGGMGGRDGEGGAYFDMQEATLLYLQRYHHKVADGLKGLVRAGLIGREDFGLFMGMGIPETIDRMLAGAVPDHRVCA